MVVWYNMHHKPAGIIYKIYYYIENTFKNAKLMYKGEKTADKIYFHNIWIESIISYIDLYWKTNSNNIMFW